MRVFLQPRPLTLSRAFHRVALALEAHKPSYVEIVNDPTQAELQVIHVIGFGSLEGIDTRIPYVIFQACLETTETPTVPAWLPVWEQAVLVWSYLDVENFLDGRLQDIHFLRTPLGVADVFTEVNPHVGPRPNTILTSGFLAGPETVEEVGAAVASLGGVHLHLGPQLPELRKFPAVRYAFGVHDMTLRRMLDTCQYVSGLRRTEGFEMIAAEGLVRGCRPILYPYNRVWFGSSADYVSEPGDLRDILEREPPAPPDVWAREQFSWKRIAGLFWQRIAEVW